MMKKTLLLLAVAACAAGTHASAQMLDISEVYGGGGNTGATYKNDFIELYNYGSTTIDLSTITALSVYYTSSAGTFTTALSTPLGTTGTIAPGAFFLIQEAAGTGGTTSLPTPNATGSINLSATNGKVALANTGTAPSSTAGAVTLGSGLVDFLGFGSANQFLTAAAPAGTNTTSINFASPSTAPTSNANDVLGNPSPGAAYIAVTAAPEPSTYACLAGGLALMGLMKFRCRAV